jgi:hypothetical protein
MNIPTLGALKPDPDIPEWLRCEPREIPFFDGQKLPFILDALEEADEQDVESAIAAFLKLGPADRLAASQYVFANYTRTAELVGEEDLDCQVESEKAIWQHVHPSEVFISRRHRRDRAIYISITAGCDWEREHGLQIVYRRGLELARVSDQDGHLTHADAYDLSEDQDKIVS